MNQIISARKLIRQIMNLAVTTSVDGPFDLAVNILEQRDRAIEQAAYERAARICDKYYIGKNQELITRTGKGPRKYNEYSPFSIAIRALKTPSSEAQDD